MRRVVSTLGEGSWRGGGKRRRLSGCLAADVVAATLDPLTGRTLAFNHTPIAAWAGHLCDLVLCGALVDSDGVITAGPVPPDLHPLMRDAFVQLQPALPRAWRWMFAPQVVDTNRSVADVRRWLVQTGVWTRRRTLFGPRYATTGAPPTPVPPEPSGDPTLRLGVPTTLVRLASSAPWQRRSTRGVDARSRHAGRRGPGHCGRPRGVEGKQSRHVRRWDGRHAWRGRPIDGFLADTSDRGGSSSHWQFNIGDRGSIAALRTLVAVVRQSCAMPDASNADVQRTVLVVYGRNRAAKDAMFSYLRALDLRPQEWASLRAATGQSSPYIGEILRRGFEVAQAVVVLSTPDDVAYLRSEYAEGDDDPATRPMGQARPNVLLEAGMAIGWNADRTVLVELGHVRSLSDLAGRHVLRLSNSNEARHELAQRLRTAGVAVDTSDGAWMSAGDFSAPAPPFESAAAESPAATGTASTPAGRASAMPTSGPATREGALTLQSNRPRRGTFGGVELNVKVTNDPDGRSLAGVVIRATFLREGEVLGSATGSIMDLGPGVTKYTDLVGQTFVQGDVEVVLQVDGSF